MKRREFITSSVAGAVGAGTGLAPRAAAAGIGAQPACCTHPQDPHRRRRLRHRLHPLPGRAHRQAAPQAALPAHRVGRLAAGHHQLVSRLLDAQRRGVAPGELHRQYPAAARLGRGAAVGGRHRLLWRQHAQPAGHLEGPRHRRPSPPGLGPRHRARRRQRRLALLVRGRHDRLASEGALHRAVPRLPEGQPLSALRRRTWSPAALPQAHRLRSR